MKNVIGMAILFAIVQETSAKVSKNLGIELDSSKNDIVIMNKINMKTKSVVENK